MTAALDGLRLAVGTLTAVPVAPPTTVDARTARWAALLAPVAVLPLGVLAGLVVWLTGLADLPSLPSALLVVGALAAGTRALHADGLSDVADALTASYDRERSLAVMKSGASGPAGTVALLVVLGLQVAGIDALLQPYWTTEPGWGFPVGPVVVGAAVCLSRWALLSTCVTGVPSARADGLGGPFAGCVPVALAAIGGVALVALAGVLGWVSYEGEAGGVERGLLTGVAALVVLGVLLHRAARRFGGTTGDVHGAGIELTLAVLLVGLVPSLASRF